MNIVDFVKYVIFIYDGQDLIFFCGQNEFLQVCSNFQKNGVLLRAPESIVFLVRFLCTTGCCLTSSLLFSAFFLLNYPYCALLHKVKCHQVYLSYENYEKI
jgi:hypothetical protein